MSPPTHRISTRTPAERRLIRLLQDAYSGERAAYFAYDGHYKSVRDETERHEIRRIRDEEEAHRQCVGGLLRELGSGPRASRERLMSLVGLTIGLLCRLGGWFIPMYGAGKLERGNIVEYVTAARLAQEAGHTSMIEPLLRMAEVEWDHEAYFRAKTLSHWAARFVPIWSPAPPRASLRNLVESAALTSKSNASHHPPQFL